MALYYTLKFSGTIRSLTWAINTHWRATSIDVGTDEAEICAGLTQMGYEFWNTLGKSIVTARVNLAKIIAVAYDTPEGFHERAAGIVGTQGGESCPEFVSKGFRQLRTNQDFRASTHRFPEVKEANNDNGSWVFDADTTVTPINGVANWLKNTHSQTLEDGIRVIDYVPVLIRTQYTTHPSPGTSSVTYLTPHQISDVGGAEFYGITSQVSRKYVTPR